MVIKCLIDVGYHLIVNKRDDFMAVLVIIAFPSSFFQQSTFARYFCQVYAYFEIFAFTTVSVRIGKKNWWLDILFIAVKYLATNGFGAVWKKNVFYMSVY